MVERKLLVLFLKNNDVPCDEIILSGAFSLYDLLRNILRSLIFESHPLGVSSYKFTLNQIDVFQVFLQTHFNQKKKTSN